MPGFRYREVLHGGFYFLGAPLDERAADLVVDVEFADATVFAASRTPTAKIVGHVKLEGFADDVHADGKLVFDIDQKRAVYDVSFDTTNGSRHRLRGHKQLEILNLVDSFTLVRASLYDDDAREMGRAMLRFDARGNWGQLLRSFRPVW